MLGSPRGLWWPELEGFGGEFVLLVQNLLCYFLWEFSTLLPVRELLCREKLWT